MERVFFPNVWLDLDAVCEWLLADSLSGKASHVTFTLGENEIGWRTPGVLAARRSAGQVRFNVLTLWIGRNLGDFSMTADPVVYAVDDDPLTLRLMRALIGVAGIEIETFNSARMFLESFDPQRPACLVLDMNLPDMNGLEVQQRLSGDGIKLPIIFLTGYGDVDTCAQAFRDGAFDFLQKPVDDGVLVRQIRKALDTDIERRQKADGLTMGNGYCDLTARETDVLKLLVAGKTLKQIAAELQITIQTAAKHRTRVLEKHGVETDVELVRLLLDVPDPGTE